MTPAILRPTTPSDQLDGQLKAMFEGEAASRTPSQDAAMLDAAIRAAELAKPLDADRRRLEAALGRGFPAAA